MTLFHLTKRSYDSRRPTGSPAAHLDGEMGVSRLAPTLRKGLQADAAVATRLRRVCGETLVVGCGQALAVAGAVVGVRLLTGALSPVVYGELALANTIAALISMVATGGIGNAASRFFAPARDKGEVRAYLRSTAYLYALTHLAVCAITVPLVAYLAVRGPEKWAKLAGVALLLAALWGAGGILDAIQNAARQRSVVALHQAAGQWLRFLGAVFLVRWLGAKSTNALYGYTAAAGLVLASQFLFYRIRIWPLAVRETSAQNDDPRQMASEMWAFGWPFAAWGAIGWLQQASDRWILAAVVDVREVGLYQALNQVGYYPVTLLAGLIAQVMAPILFALAGDGTDPVRAGRARRAVNALAALTFAVTLAATALCSIMHGRVFSLVVAAEYRAVSGLLPLVVLGSGLFATGQMLAYHSLVQINSRALLAPKIGSGVLAVALNYLGARSSGLMGVVCAGVGSSGFYALWVYILSRSQDQRHWARAGLSTGGAAATTERPGLGAVQ